MTGAKKPLTHVQRTLPWVLVVDTILVVSAFGAFAMGYEAVGIAIFVLSAAAVAFALIRASRLDKAQVARPAMRSIVE